MRLRHFQTSVAFAWRQPFMMSSLGKIATPAATQDLIAAVGLPPPLAGYTSSPWW
jgi:hypothetical protein